VRGAIRRHPPSRSGGLGSLLCLTLVAAFLYLSGAVSMVRHDGLYAALLAAVWGFYFMHEPLLRMRVFGPLLIRTGQLLLLAAAAGFFGGIYWLILSAHG
jgi:hypothetical protein